MQVFGPFLWLLALMFLFAAAINIVRAVKRAWIDRRPLLRNRYYGRGRAKLENLKREGINPSDLPWWSTRLPRVVSIPDFWCSVTLMPFLLPLLRLDDLIDRRHHPDFGYMTYQDPVARRKANNEDLEMALVGISIDAVVVTVAILGFRLSSALM